MPNVPITTGLLKDLNLQDLIPIPGPIGDIIKSAVGVAISVVDHDPDIAVPAPVPEPWNQAPVQTPEGFPQPTITVADTGIRGEIVKAIDTAIGAIGLLLKLSWLIPDQYEGPLKVIVKGLLMARTWVD